MTLQILQFGTTGQLATELLRQASSHDVSVTALGRAEADLVDPAACAAKVRDRKPELVVIAAAHTAVDLAESETDIALAVNATSPGAIAAGPGSRP